MSTTSISTKLGDYDAPWECRARLRSTAVRVRVAVKRDELTRELAAGAPPGLSPELSLRAARLVRPRRCRQLARTWRGTIKEARNPAIFRGRVSIICCGAVIDAEDAINALIARLRSDRPVTVKGMAMLHRVMTDGMSSPLYCRSEPGTLRHEIMLVTKALDPDRAEVPSAG